uniref:Uncharacterized protein n=1 Tax=Gossypium raimondii TaxID=29730 RepID=A0A0D2QYM4_GOSRA|nr:hypothetical protein B456_004G159500 [Gossypium raimondii]
MDETSDGVTEIHRDINNLIADLEIPLIDWDDKWLDVYLDISVKLLDISVAFTSEITRLNQSHLLLQCVLHKLESHSPERFMQDCSSLDSWRQHIGTKNPRLETFHPILHNLVESLNLPKVTNSAKGKLLYTTMGIGIFRCANYSEFRDGFGSNEGWFQNSVSDLRRTAEELSQALDNLSKAVDGYFKIVSTGGYALLCNLRTSVGVPNSMLGRKVEEQAVR